MTPALATLLCFGCIACLLWIDRGRGEGVSGAVWIPLLWMFFAGSRFASQWWDLGPPVAAGAEAFSDGSPFDRNVFLALVISGTLVLLHRRLSWSTLIKRNAWIFLFFLFCAASILWSDDPFISFKRWVKGFGNLVMALVLATDKRPYEALGFVLRRLGFVLLPLSILFIRYYPDLGRLYHMGQPMFTGVTFQKNTLGQLCMLVGVYVGWYVLLRRLEPRAAPDRARLTATLTLVPMLAWLLYTAQSATAIVLMLAAISFFLLVRLPTFHRNPNRLLVVGIAIVGLYLVLEQFFGIKDSVIRMLGREPDLTDRTPVWELVLGMATHPLIGAGYESFWSGQRLTEIWTRIGDPSGGIIQAHNGYIDLYLNLGVIGLALLVAAIISGLLSAQRHLRTGFKHSALRIAIILTAVGYNYTEAAYKPLNNVFILLLFSILEMERSNGLRHQSQAARPVIAGRSA